MTSTGRGEMTGRSSSRVLRPPGGGTSIILGIADEPKPTTTATATTTTTVSNDNDVNVESSRPETESQQDVDAAAAAAAEAADEGVNNIEDEEQKVEDEEEQRVVAAAAEVNANTVSDAKPVKTVDAADIKKNQAIGFNPITGQPYNNNNNAQLPDSSTKAQIRVRQPPGGASTKLW